MNITTMQITSLDKFINILYKLDLCPVKGDSSMCVECGDLYIDVFMSDFCSAKCKSNYYD